VETIQHDVRPVTTFDDLLGEHAGASMAKQLALVELLGDAGWTVDLAAGTADFGGGHRYPIQLLGTESTVSGTWLWSWANARSQLPRPVLTAAERLRAIGDEAGIAELTRPTFRLPPTGGHLLALVASGVCGADAYWRGAYAGGAVYFLLFQTPLARRAQLAIPRVVAILTQAVAAFDVDHHRTATTFLRAQGFGLHERDRALRAWRPDGATLTARFDEADRLATVQFDG
jgi:uncharacterized protein DUF6882